MEVKYFQDSHTRVKRRENMICAHVIRTMHNFVSYLSKTLNCLHRHVYKPPDLSEI